MTPIIDIVFLLIVFFMVICKFIEAENFPVDVPDGCEFAQTADEHQSDAATVTVMTDTSGKVAFAVGSEKVSESEPGTMIEKLAELIDTRLRNLPADRRVVTLRIDREVHFAHAQYALAGIAESSATDIQLAVSKHTQTASE